MFFDFSQNNSFGRFDFDKKAGITHFVIVEADNYQEANDRAMVIGLYFDGLGDCPCCGNRWSEQWDYNKGTEHPTVYDIPVQEYDGSPWMKDGLEIAVHYANGKIEWFGCQPYKKKSAQTKSKKKTTKKKTTKKTNARKTKR